MYITKNMLLIASNLHFQREVPILRDFSLTAKSGELIGLHGANGAGKSTLLKLLAGLLQPQQGSITWQGKPLSSIWPEYSQQRCFIGHELALKSSFTAYENIKYQTCLMYQSLTFSFEHLLHELQLYNERHKTLNELSQGQRKRLSLARLLIPGPKLWLLDEPFAHLDQNWRDWLTHQLTQLQQQGQLVIFTNHQSGDLALNQNIDLEALT